DLAPLPALARPDLPDQERARLVRFGRADVRPADRYGGLEVRRKGGVRESPFGPDRAVEPGRKERRGDAEGPVGAARRRRPREETQHVRGGYRALLDQPVRLARGRRRREDPVVGAL